MIASTTGVMDKEIKSALKSIKILPEHWPEREDSKFEDTVEDTKILLLFSLISKSRRLDDDDALLDDGAFPSFCASCCSFNV